MKTFKSRWHGLSWESRMLILFTAIAALPLFISLWPEASRTPSEGRVELDTHIPKGFVLIPIEVENYEALDSILGRFGIVDLFRSQDGRREKFPVARNVRLLRAPHNPMHFAALVPETRSSEILSHSGSYVVVVKREGGGTEFVKPDKVPRRKIIYGGPS